VGDARELSRDRGGRGETEVKKSFSRWMLMRLTLASGYHAAGC
jgi:hypothetical protein